MIIEVKGKELVLVVDDNPFSREGLAIFLKRKGYAALEAGDSESALELIDGVEISGAIVDIVLPEHRGGTADMAGSEGIKLARHLKRMHPSLGVLIFSAFNDRGSEVLELAADGARGLAYMVKGSHPDKVLEALVDAQAGKVVLGSDVLNYANELQRDLWQRLAPDETPWVRQAVAHFGELTQRECEVARLLAVSRTTQGIAETLDISLKTVEKHTNSIYHKLRLNGVDQLQPPLRKAVLLAKVCWFSELGEQAWE